MNRYIEFPKGFLWGTAVSAYQTEGNNSNTDWWEWEKKPKKKNQKYPRDASGIACDSYNRYVEDLDLCDKLNNNSIRLSIEWARIEPNRGEFDQKEINHYRKVLKSAKDRGLQTFVTLHHFTNPKWFSKLGGWVNPISPQLFENYSKKCAQEFGDLVDAFLTINEPHVYVVYSYANGKWPPNQINPIFALLVQNNFIKAHQRSYNIIKSLNPSAKVGLPINVVWFEPGNGILNILDRIICKTLYFFNLGFFMLHIKEHIDLLGLNYYFTIKIKNLWPVKPKDLFREPKSFMNDTGLEKILIDLKKYNKPLYVTENGIPDETDEYRPTLIKNMLYSCWKAIKKGVDLRGYFHWSLIDNFEWHHGYWPRFGLVEVDRQNNLERKPRKSFYYYASISKSNGLEI